VKTCDCLFMTAARTLITSSQLSAFSSRQRRFFDLSAYFLRCAAGKPNRSCRIRLNASVRVRVQGLLASVRAASANRRSTRLPRVRRRRTGKAVLSVRGGRWRIPIRADTKTVWDLRRSARPRLLFDGLGPKRKGCIECAGCMVGCRYNAKNTLDKNYLWFAENLFGAKILAETLVEKIIPTVSGYKIQTKSSTGFFSKHSQEFIAKGVVVSGGVLGTLDLLLKQKFVHKTLPDLSEKLGTNVLTNSEMLSGVTAANRKLNYGLAISSVFNPDDNTHIELCKFPNGSGAMLRLATMAAGNGTPLVRTAKMIGNMIAHPWNSLRALFNFKTAYNSVVLLIMQTLPNSMKMKMKRGIFGWRLQFDNSSSEKVPSYIPIGQEVLHRYAKKVNGVASNAVTEVLFGLSSTAHILGGCPMGKTAQEGVIDKFFRVHGYPNFYILDGSIVPCNLGVNPSLTITALSEYAMSNIPKKKGSITRSLDELMVSNIQHQASSL